MEFFVVQTLSGFSFAAVLFMLASGLSLIFGVMHIVNIAHGSYYMLGAYIGLSVYWVTGSFALAILGGALAIAAIGYGMQRFFLRRFFYGAVHILSATARFSFRCRVRVFAVRNIWIGMEHVL